MRPSWAYLASVHTLDRLGAWCRCARPDGVENIRQVIVCQMCRGLIHPEESEMKEPLKLVAQLIDGHGNVKATSSLENLTQADAVAAQEQLAVFFVAAAKAKLAEKK